VQYGDAVTELENAILGIGTKEREEQKRLAELKKQKLERFTQFFGRVNSAFTFRKVTVKIEDSHLSAPAWSTASEVTFNSRMIEELDSARAIAGIKGLDLHEISHILYTSREGSELFDYVRENKFFMAYNCLEDARIEFLFTSKYPSTIDWFTSTILIHFVDKPDAITSSYPLLCGRRYLPVELRARSRNLYPHQELVDDISAVVTEYRSLLFPADTEKGKELIAKFHDLLQQAGDGEGEGGNGEGEGGESGEGGTGKGKIRIRISDPFGHGSRPHEGLETSAQSRPQPARKQANDLQNALANDGEDEKELAESLKNADVTDIDIDIEFNDADDSDSDSSNDSDSDSDDANDSGDATGGDSAGDSAGDIVNTLIDNLLEDILNDADNVKELNDTLRQLGGLTSLSTNKSKEPELNKYHSLTPDANTFQASLAFGRELERLRATFDPAWDKYQSQGRIDAHRYLRGDELDTVFDQWNEGREDATEIECVIALDVSGSMSGSKATNAYRAMYAIKRALDRIEANCTVITFHDSTHVLYRAKDKAGAQIRDAGTGGGTVATDAITYATKLLAETEKPVRLFVAITDGEWSGNQDANHDAIKRMNNAGVLTALAYIPSGEESVTLDIEKSHHCEIATVVRNPIDLIGLVRSIVKHGINRRLVSH
jgi:predicted metal-dependent peptidase